MQLETERLRILPLPQLKLRLEGMPRFEHEATAPPAELAEEIPSACPWAANWQIIWKERNCSVGSAGFMNVPDETGEVEIRCGIAPAFQRRGFMTEALRAIAAWALEQPGVTGVIAETEPENTASRRVLARCGFKRFPRRAGAGSDRRRLRTGNSRPERSKQGFSPPSTAIRR